MSTYPEINLSSVRSSIRLFNPDQPANPPPPPRKKKKRRSFRYVWETHLKKALTDSGVTLKHISEVELHLGRWESYWDGLPESWFREERICYPLLPGTSRQHLESWRRALLSNLFGKMAATTINKHLGSIRSLMVCAEKHTIIKSRARLEQLTQSASNPTRKVYMRDQQLDALMVSAPQLRWPRESAIGMTAGEWWQCALVMYRTYGFRVQELMAYESAKKPITWENITFEIESPNPASESTNEYGWLFYVPPKTKRRKPEPLFLPLTKYTRSALDRLAKARISTSEPLFRVPRCNRDFFDAWYKWQSIANVKPKIPGQAFKPYCLRKTCATHMSRHRMGLATAICRWGSYSGENREAKVASDHYISDDLLLQELHTAPMPKSFDQFLIQA